MSERMDKRVYRAMQFALGYMNLDMPEEAERELAALPAELQALPEVMSFMAQTFMLREDWSHAINIAETGFRRYPEVADFYVQRALAYEQMGEPQRAIDVWESSPEEVRDGGFCHFNIARCEMRLGNLAAARRHVQRAIKLEPSLKARLKEDPFLSALPKAMPPLN